jgi:phosphoglycolate phosphatase-like HAD superfamily hydrolase
VERDAEEHEDHARVVTPPDARQGRLLGTVLADVEAAPGAQVVFDLDDTLFSTARRHLRILREYADLVESSDPEAAGLLRAIDRESLRYSVVDTAKDAGLRERLTRDLRAFWFARFFQNRYLLEDDVVAGAPAFCEEVAARGGIVVYMTGRDEGMRAGTEESLAKHGFPRPGGTAARLILKPAFDAPDLAFKTEALARVRAAGRVAASFENEPAHVNLFRETFPSARHFLLETRHSGRPVLPHPDVHRIRDFRR